MFYLSVLTFLLAYALVQLISNSTFQLVAWLVVAIVALLAIIFHFTGSPVVLRDERRAP